MVFDAVYAPRVTRLLREAEECGIKVVSGVEMFIRQAMGQFEHFTGGIEGVMFSSAIALNPLRVKCLIFLTTSIFCSS